ncbi:hypothetical protein BsWGS_02568 [Bradybaena similaris]
MNDIHKSRQSKHIVNISPVTRPEHRNSTLRHSNGEKSDSRPHLSQMKPRYLIDYHVEKPVQFIGEVVGVSPDLDVTNRTDVLRIVDKGKRQGVLSSRVTPEHYALLCLSVFHIEVSKYHTSQDLLLRIPMHEIAAVCYIKDDQQHLLAFKFGTQESCKLALMLCESKPVAEEICTLVSQCFTLVYNEATISSTERHPSTSSGTESTLLYRPGTMPYLTDFPRNFKVPSDSGSGRNSFSDTGAGKELLDDYMKKLTTKLSPEELRQFLQHLNDWKSDSPFPEFCDEVLHLLGDERKQLLSDLLPFIPADNYPYFEEFLRRNDIQILDTTSTLSSSRTDLRTYSTRRSLSEVSTTSSISNNLASADALDHLLDLAKAEYNSVDVDVPEDY